MIIQVQFRRIGYSHAYYRITYDDSKSICQAVTASIIRSMRPIEAMYGNPFNIKFKNIIIIS